MLAIKNCSRCDGLSSYGQFLTVNVSVWNAFECGPPASYAKSCPVKVPDVVGYPLRVPGFSLKKIPPGHAPDTEKFKLIGGTPPEVVIVYE